MFILLVLSVAINGLPVITGAIEGLMERRVNVDQLLSLLLVACLLQGELLTAAVVSTVIVLGSVIEEATEESARRSIQALINFSPKQRLVVENGEEHAVAVEQVRIGDVLLVKPGDQIPVDGQVLEGVSSVDESTMTGEAMPVSKQPGDKVFAGTLNHNGVFRLGAQKVGSDTTLGRIIRLVSEAENQRPATLAFIERFSPYFTPFILGCAALAWIFSGEFDRAVTVLIVGCPCALILAVPTATIAAVGRAPRDVCTEIGLGVRGRVNGQLIEVGRMYLHGGIGSVPVAFHARLAEIQQQDATPLMVYRDTQPLGCLAVSDRLNHCRAEKTGIRRDRYPLGGSPAIGCKGGAAGRSHTVLVVPAT